MVGRKYKVIVSPEARDDLRRELDYIRRKWSVQRARIVRDGITQEIAKLENLPNRHPKLHRISSEERVYRFVPKWDYLIIFRIEVDQEDHVRVVSIFSSSQNPDNIDTLKGV